MEEMPLLTGSPAACGADGTAPTRLPQNIGHRGYKAAFPENSMAAFHGAVAAGAHGIETDVHLSRDGVVVLSHDATLKRCFGLPSKIIDCDWSYLRTLKTLAEPHQGMPRLADLLEWLTQPEHEAVWVLLDIKTDDDPEVLLPAIARTIAAVPVGEGGRPWRERVIVGAWNENYITHSRMHLPSFPLAYIGFSLLYARRFLSSNHPDVHFNLFQPVLVGPLGAHFRRAVRRHGRKLFVWTVNDPQWMEWAIKKGVDGVITDEVGRYKDVRDGFKKSVETGGGGEVGRL
ncbi:hypothetical protein N0V88_001039 [Collariella sp. IMI 366227]|nr:hypothetical protein N0V88_001039 [Collariella sp. IMI 366227]